MIFGGEDGTNLEPDSAALLLQTLEEWSDVLKHDEELTHTLAEFKKAPLEHEDRDSGEGVSFPDVEPQSDWEPSP